MHRSVEGTKKWGGEESAAQPQWDSLVFAEWIWHTPPPFPFASLRLFCFFSLGYLCRPRGEQEIWVALHAQHGCGEQRRCTQRLCRATHKTKSASYFWFRSVTAQGWTYKMLFGLAAAVEKFLPVHQLCPSPRSKPEPQLNIPLFKHCI